MHGINVELCREVHWLKPEFGDSTDASPEGHRPDIFAGCLPVGGEDWRRGDVPTFVQVVVDEVLQQHLVHIWTASRSSDRPNIVDQGSNCPVFGLS